MPISKAAAIKRYFSTPEKPVTIQEQKELMADKAAFEELAAGAARELGETLMEAKSE